MPNSGIPPSPLSGVAYACCFRTHRRQKLRQADASKQFGAHPILNRVDYFSSILGWIDMYPERPFAERGVDNCDDRIRHRTRIRVAWHDRGKTLEYPIGHALVWARFIVGDPAFVGG
jgi:hypothetical protein